MFCTLSGCLLCYQTGLSADLDVIICTSLALSCPLLYVDPLCSSLSLLPLLLSLNFIHLALSTQLMRLIRAVSLSATGTASVPLLSLKELWDRFMHTAFVQLEGSWLQKPNRDSFYVKLWFKEWEHGLVWSKNGPISVTVILRRFVNAIQPQNRWHFQILTDFFHNMCKMHIRCTSHKS